MKILSALCAAALIPLAFFYHRASESVKPTPQPTLASPVAFRQDEVCDECICETCRQTPEQLPKTGLPCPSVIESKWDLWRAGTCLRGVNTWQKTAERDGRAHVIYTYDVPDIAPLKTLGANYVNISFPGIYSVLPKGDGYVLEEEVLGELKRLVKRYREANLFVVVSFRTGPGRNESVFGGETEPAVTDLWTSEPARKAWVEMWKRASAELRGESNVVGYDLMVEPVLEPERVKGPDGVENPAENAKRYRLWYDLAREIAGAIRDGGDETPILIGGAKGSPACALQCLPPLKFPHIVYTVHQYEPYDYTHQAGQKSDYDCDDPRAPSPRPRRIARPRNAKEQLERIYGLLQGFRRANGSAPVAVNEFGVYRWAPDAGKHLKDEMRLIERVGANHALWLWEPQTTCVDYDAFNYLHGSDFSKHRPDLENSLLKAIKEIWRSNTAFPNNVTFRSGQRR